MQEKPFKRKPLTKADIERIRKTLPKRVEIKADGQTEVTEKEEPVEVAPILESQAPEISVPLSAEEIRSFQIYASMLREKNKVMNLTAVDDEQTRRRREGRRQDHKARGRRNGRGIPRSAP